MDYKKGGKLFGLIRQRTGRGKEGAKSVLLGKELEQYEVYLVMYVNLPLKRKESS